MAKSYRVEFNNYVHLVPVPRPFCSVSDFERQIKKSFNIGSHVDIELFYDQAELANKSESLCDLLPESDAKIIRAYVKSKSKLSPRNNSLFRIPKQNNTSRRSSFDNQDFSAVGSNRSTPREPTNITNQVDKQQPYKKLSELTPRQLSITLPMEHSEPTDQSSVVNNQQMKRVNVPTSERDEAVHERIAKEDERKRQDYALNNNKRSRPNFKIQAEIQTTSQTPKSPECTEATSYARAKRRKSLDVVCDIVEHIVPEDSDECSIVENIYSSHHKIHFDDNSETTSEILSVEKVSIPNNCIKTNVSNTSTNNPTKSNIPAKLTSSTAPISRPTPKKYEPSQARIRTLKSKHTLNINSETTLEQLRDNLWTTIESSGSHCRRDKYHLLLFNHRVHLFPTESTVLVRDLLTITPEESSTPHLYVHLIKKSKHDIYEYENDITQILKKSTWWIPGADSEHPQCHRSQCALIKSLHALRELFQNKTDVDELWRDVEENFFIGLNTFCYPPAVLALRHAIHGAIFHFEKSLILDALINTLEQFCPATKCRSELCEATPLFFSWLLEQKFETTKSDQQLLLDDSQRNSKKPTQSIETQTDIDIKMMREFFNSINRSMDGYYINEVYIPQEKQPICPNKQQTEELYEIMDKRYPLFAAISRSILGTQRNEQIIFLENSSTSIAFRCESNDSNSTPIDNTNKDKNNSPLFQIVNMNDYTTIPLRTVPISVHLKSNMAVEKLTVFLLDISSSMSRKVDLPDSHSFIIIDESKKMLFTLINNLLKSTENQAFGLILFGEFTEVKCSLTTHRRLVQDSLRNLNFKYQKWTKMYDAVCEAVKLIQQYQRCISVNFASSCIKRIICISDGINNRGTLKIDQVRAQVKRENIIIDFISFLPDATLDELDKLRVEQFQELCLESNGSIFKFIRFVKENFPQDATKTFFTL